MEIVSICVPQKDGSILDIYPSEFIDPDFDLGTYESFCKWAIENMDSAGNVDLGCRSYDNAVDLLGTDDLRCPSCLRIICWEDNSDYSISIPFSRLTTNAYVSSEHIHQ